MKILCAFSRAVLPLVGLLATAAVLIAAEPKQPELTDRPDQQIKRLKVVAPVYPYNMKTAGVMGEVVIAFVVNTEGRVINPIVIRSNNPWFERPAIEAILQWTFQPARKNGRAVDCKAQQLMNFASSYGANELWQPTNGKDHDKLPEEYRWDEAPRPTMSTYPVYPAEALQAKQKGRAVVRYVVDTKGRVLGATIVEASAPEFGGAAMAAVDAWRFKPGTREGKPCFATVEMAYDFDPTGDISVPVSSGMRDVARELERKVPRICPFEKLDAVPKPLSRRPPVYPSVLHDAGQPGEAMIEFYIDKNGDAQLPRIVSASAPEFGYAAAQAVATWRFEPPLADGKAVIARAQIPVNFTVHDHVKAKKQPATKENQP